MSNSAINLAGPMGPAQYRNKLINGDFSIWQRGNTFGISSDGSTTGYAYFPSYTTDRWIVADGAPADWLAGGTCGCRVTRGNFDELQNVVPGYPDHYLKFKLQNSNGDRTSISQRIEDCRIFAGKSVTISFWARVQGLTGGGLSNLNRLPIAVECAQYLGGKTGATEKYDSSTAHKMKRGATGAKSDPYGVDHNVIVKRADMNITTSWAKYSTTLQMPNLAGMTLGLDNDELKTTDNPFTINMMNKPSHYTSIKILMPGSTFDIQDGVPIFGAGSSSRNKGATISYEVNVALVQAEQDDGASEFEYRGAAAELRLASRYYQRVFYGHNGHGTPPAGSWGSTCLFPVPMRVVPVPVRKTNAGTWGHGRWEDSTSAPEHADYGAPGLGGLGYGGTNDVFYGNTTVNELGFMPSFKINSTDDGQDYVRFGVMDFDAEIASWASHRHASKTLTNPGGINQYSNNNPAASTTDVGIWQESKQEYVRIART